MINQSVTLFYNVCQQKKEGCTHDFIGLVISMWLGTHIYPYFYLRYMAWNGDAWRIPCIHLVVLREEGRGMIKSDY